MTKTVINVVFMGGPRDGETKRVSMDREAITAGRVRLEGVVYLVLTGSPVMFVHPSAARLYN